VPSPNTGHSLSHLCEHFDQGTLSLGELRLQLAAQQLDSTPQDITNVLDSWIRLDILVPVAKSPNRFELNAQIHDFLAYLRKRTPPRPVPGNRSLPAPPGAPGRLYPGRLRHPRRPRSGAPTALLDMRVRDVLKKLANDEQALVAVADRAKTSDRQIPLRQRYAEVLATWDEYVEPMIQLVNADGAFEQGVRKVENVLLRMLSEQQRLGHLVDDDMLLRTHARILEMQTSAQLTLRHARELLLPLREEARRHNAVTRGAALALAAIRRKGPGRGAASGDADVHPPAKHLFGQRQPSGSLCVCAGEFRAQAGALPQGPQIPQGRSPRRRARSRRCSTAAKTHCRCRT
jgi:hypothetical protein